MTDFVVACGKLARTDTWPYVRHCRNEADALVVVPSEQNVQEEMYLCEEHTNEAVENFNGVVVSVVMH